MTKTHKTHKTYKIQTMQKFLVKGDVRLHVTERQYDRSEFLGFKVLMGQIQIRDTDGGVFIIPKNTKITKKLLEK